MPATCMRSLIPEPIRDIAGSTAKVLGKNPTREDCRDFVRVALRVGTATAMMFASFGASLALGVGSALIASHFTAEATAIVIGKAVSLVSLLAAHGVSYFALSKSASRVHFSVFSYVQGFADIVGGAVSQNPLLVGGGLVSVFCGLWIGSGYKRGDSGILNAKIELLSQKWGDAIYKSRQGTVPQKV